MLAAVVVVVTWHCHCRFGGMGGAVMSSSSLWGHSGGGDRGGDTVSVSSSMPQQHILLDT